MRIDDSTPEAIADKFRRLAPSAHRMKIRMNECLIGVTASEQKIVEYLKDYFRPFLSEDKASADIEINVYQCPAPEVGHNLKSHTPTSLKSRIKESFADIDSGRIVKKLKTGMVFVFGSGVHLAAGPCMENINQVINFINNRFIESRLDKGGLLAHAAGVCLGNKGLGLAGFSGAGKSSLALRLVSMGADFISNDRLILMTDENRTQMLGVAKHPRVNPGTLLNNPDLAGILPEAEKKRYSSMDKSVLWAVDSKYDVVLHHVFPENNFSLQAPLNAMVILNWRLLQTPTSIRKVDPARRPDLLQALIKSPGVFYRTNNCCNDPINLEKSYIHALKNSEVYEISGGIDFEYASDFFIQFLRSGEVAAREAE
jgi:HprK-related kinase B